MNRLVLGSSPWARRCFARVSAKNPGWWRLIDKTDPKSGTLESALAGGAVDRVYVLHWSDIIPQETLRRAEFVGFHASDLPNYRGSSTLQHQILAGRTSTEVTCFKLDHGVDSGPIIFQERLSLEGSMPKIMRRIERIVAGMITSMEFAPFKAYPQAGPLPPPFKRLAKADRVLNEDMLGDTDYLEKMIRAWGPPYPGAELKVRGATLTFRSAKFVDSVRDGHALRAVVDIT